MAPRKKIGPTLTRIFWMCAGIALITFSLIGRDYAGQPLAVWRRSAGIGGGMFFVYCGLAYYLPASRRRRGSSDKPKAKLPSQR